VKNMNIKDWATLTTDAVSASLRSVIGYLPKVFGALVVILIGVLVAWAVKTVIVRVLKFFKLKPYTDAIGLNKVFPEDLKLADLLGDLAKWIIMIVFLLPALEILDFPQVNALVANVVAYLPNVIIAVAIVVVGAVVADLVSRVVESAAVTIGAKTAAIVADVARWSIVVFVVLAALLQLGIATVIIDRVVTGFVALLAIAGGLAFGLGGQDAAKEVIARLKKNLPR
jgi:small-conductance mechanosensitive channel